MNTSSNKSSTICSAVLAAWALGASPASVQAATLVNWTHTSGSDFAGAIIDTTGSVGSAANVSSTGTSWGGLGTGTKSNLTAAGGGTGTGLSYIAPYQPGTSGLQAYYDAGFTSSTPVATQYISYRFTVAATIDISVSSLQGITFNLSPTGTSAPRGVEVTYRVGDSGSFTSLGTTRTPTTTAGAFGLFTFDLGDPVAFIAGEAVEFRLLGYGGGIRLDNVSITAIPEPSTLALLGLTGVALLRRRRPRKSKP